MNAFNDPVFQNFNAFSIKTMIERAYKLAEEGESEKISELMKSLAFAVNVPGSGYGPGIVEEVRSRTKEILEKVKNDVPPPPD